MARLSDAAAFLGLPASGTGLRPAAHIGERTQGDEQADYSQPDDERLARHKVEVQLAPNLPLAHMDFVLMQEALKNLLSNAALHTPPGTLVQVGARVRDGALRFTVADGGPGIPANSLPRVFDKFYRAPGARTGGTGLGLSIAKGFVEAQGGRITAENRADGGALFTISLPVGHLVPVAAA